MGSYFLPDFFFFGFSARGPKPDLEKNHNPKTLAKFAPPPAPKFPRLFFLNGSPKGENQNLFLVFDVFFWGGGWKNWPRKLCPWGNLFPDRNYLFFPQKINNLLVFFGPPAVFWPTVFFNIRDPPNYILLRSLQKVFLFRIGKLKFNRMPTRKKSLEKKKFNKIVFFFFITRG